jgi:ABC-type Fe3+ transport system substrate-binding protein
MTEKTERRGRPAEQPFVPQEKWIREYYEVPSKPELGYKMTYYYDVNKNANGPYKTEIVYPKGYKHDTFKVEKGKAYNGQPVVLVFKTSNRSNAQTKMKVFANENIDYIMSANKLVGVPETAVILECGVGESFIDAWKSKYSL